MKWTLTIVMVTLKIFKCWVQQSFQGSFSNPPTRQTNTTSLRCRYRCRCRWRYDDRWQRWSRRDDDGIGVCLFCNVSILCVNGGQVTRPQRFNKRGLATRPIYPPRWRSGTPMKGCCTVCTSILYLIENQIPNKSFGKWFATQELKLRGCV